MKQLMLIDFGLSRKYRLEGVHVAFDTQAMAGTKDFISRSALKNEVQSRRDDLEAWIYMVIYVFKQKLPWTGMTWESMAMYKTNITEEQLVDGLP